MGAAPKGVLHSAALFSTVGGGKSIQLLFREEKEGEMRHAFTVDGGRGFYGVTLA